MGYKLKRILIYPDGVTEKIVYPAYQQVEYIQSDGIGCCIDTGISPKDSTYLGLDFKIRPTALKANNNYFYSAGANPRCSFEYKDSKGYWNTGSSTKQGGHSMSVNNDYTYSIRYSNGSFSCSGAYNGSFNYSGTTLGTGNLVFFCFATDLTAQSAERLYNLKIYQGSSFVLVRDFIPCYRKSDNVIGLFDKVNNKFYANVGSGTFTKGPNV